MMRTTKTTTSKNEQQPLAQLQMHLTELVLAGDELRIRFSKDQGRLLLAR